MRCSLRPLCPFFALVSATSAHAQSHMLRQIPETPRAGDLDEVDEVEEESEDDLLSTRGRRAKLFETEDELSLSAEEQRARKVYLVTAFLGQALPWQTYGITAGSVYTPHLILSMYAGGGSYKMQGNIIRQKAYDLRVNTRVVGFETRYFVPHLDLLSLAASLGYASWDGQVSPHGSDDQVVDQAEKLSTSFHAKGVTAGVAAALGWSWPNGVYVEWTLIGIQRSRIFQRDLSRDSTAAWDAVRRDVESARAIGVYDLKVGYYF